MKNYKLSVVIEKDADGYFAFCPELQDVIRKGILTRKLYRVSKMPSVFILRTDLTDRDLQTLVSRYTIHPSHYPQTLSLG